MWTEAITPLTAPTSNGLRYLLFLPYSQPPPYSNHLHLSKLRFNTAFYLTVTMELALTVPSASTHTNVLLAQLSAIPPLLAPKNAEGSPSIISSLQLLPQTVYLAVLLCLQAFIPTQVNHIVLITNFTLPLVRCLVHNQFPIIIGLSQQYYS